MNPTALTQPAGTEPTRTPPARTPPARQGVSFTWTAFLVMCFAVVGLVGVFGTFAAGLPLRRELAREVTLDEALLALRSPAPQVALEALRPRLDDSAPALFPLPADPVAAIGAERQAVRARFLTEADAITYRMQLMILIVTCMAAVFGSAILAFGRRSGAG
jgi:hypothetical protein